MENSKRYYIILAALGILLLGYTIRLFHLQVLDKSYRRKANENAIREKTIHPARGFIYDRNDSLLVYNDAAYDLMVVPNELRNFDTLELCRVLDLNIEEVRKKIEKATKYSKTVPSLFKQQISCLKLIKEVSLHSNEIIMFMPCNPQSNVFVTH